MSTGQGGWLEGIHAFFNHPGLRKFWCRIRYPFGAALLVLLAGLFWKGLIRIEPRWFWLGFDVSMVGEIIQLWCFASLKKEKVLACRGPYVLVRNPMYLGRFFIVLGVILLLGEPGLWAVVPYTLFYWFYMYNRVRREESKLIGIFGADYEAYCRNVNRFLPSPRGGNLQNVMYWKWALLTGNHGWLNLAALLGAYAVLYVFAFGLIPFKLH
jgi:protein-S-isoprenylcysteine O-methyltransferase Ste14